MEIKIESQMARMKQLYTLHDSFKAMPEPNITKGYLEAQSKVLNDLWNRIDNSHTVIFETLLSEERNKQDYFIADEFGKVFETYVKTLTRIQNKLDKLTKTATTTTTIPQPTIHLPENIVLNANNNKSNIKLKPIDIPIFSGDYKKWISFKNMFDSLIHNQNEFNNLQKIHYLKSCLSGEAERIISQFDITENSYQPAYDAITERFHNEVVLIDTHIISILSQPNLTTEASDSLKEMMDVTTENIRALNSLNVDTTTWDPILLLLLIQKLDPSTRRLWEQNLKPKVRPTMKEFLEFLGTRFHSLGCQQNFKFSIESTSGNTQQRNNRRQFSTERRYNNYNPHFQNKDFPPRVHQNFHNSSESIQRKCPFRCGGFHNLIECDRFNKAETRMKIDLVACAHLCSNCLKGHAGRCYRPPGCQKCAKDHHTLLHLDEEKASSNNPCPSTNTPNTFLSSFHAHVQPSEDQALDLINSVSDRSDLITWDEPVLLATAIILVRSTKDNSFYPFRALLDQASEASYISEYAAQFLGLKRKNILASTSGLGGVKTGVIKGVADFEIQSKRNPLFQINVQAPVVTKVTNLLPSTRLRKVDWKHIKDLQLADPEFHVPGKIDILLGAPVYGYLLLPGLIKVSPEFPVAQNTEFGWILSGATRSTTSVKYNIASFHLRVEVDDQLKKFFEQEEVSKERILTQEEVKCEQFFEETVRRNDDGRYVVALPFKDEPNLLGSSKGQAISRLMKLETRFAANKDLKKEYLDILKEYESLGHTSVSGNLAQQNESLSFYLPHHAVFKPESTTTKTRIVFDASAKSTTGVSLNDLLMTGPTLQQDLSSILTRWRSHKFVFSADITKMYRQVMVREEDRKFIKFLFRENENEPIREYQHNMVTFGVTSATYLAVKTLQKLALDERKNYLEASDIVLRDFYMDDVMSGADSVQHGIKICKDLRELLASGKFELRKFISNSTKLLESIPEEDRELKLPLEINLDNTVKTLGIRYHPTTDIFQFKVNVVASLDWPTKRSLLSESSKLFDPLGWLAPVVIKAKIFFQELWQEGLSWDQKLPKHIADKWMTFRNELHHLEKIKIDRWTRQGKDTEKVELHGFGDASEKAYSAVVYSRIVSRDGSIKVTLLSAKTRVAPLKPITLPRLELCGAVLVANLMDTVATTLNIDKSRMHAWSDSTVVLGWLRANPSKLKTFVANRTVEAHNYLNIDHWHHIEGEKNPADCASRGLNPSELKDHSLWWNGPDCLREHRSSWNQELVIPPATLELKSSIVKSHLVIANEESWEKYIDMYSDFSRLVRVTAFLQRFINNTRSRRAPDNKITNPILTVKELQQAKNCLIRLDQEKEFAREIHMLNEKQSLNQKSNILSLNPFLDEDGLLRVGGRLDESNLPYERKHPLILSSGPLTKLIIADAHHRALHGGTKLTMNLVKDHYWIINLRRKVKGHILRCVKCFRYKAIASEQIMGTLPRARVVETNPFTHTGVDYAGPFNIKASNIKAPPIRIKPTIIDGKEVKSIPKVPTYKGYIALFVCFATKAVHLEVVSDQTTGAFMAALKRFTSRRGSPSDMYSDNGSTFVGTKNVLSVEFERSLVDYKTVANYLTKKQIQWHFIAPKNPSHGGLWESGIRLMKHHLRRCIGNMTLTYEELTTVINQIEACLNSRPLYPLTDEPGDVSVLTPGHFLIGRPLITPPSSNANQFKGDLRERWRLQQKLLQDIWEAWSKDYLSQLQQRVKWRLQRKNLKKGDIVFLKEDDLPPTSWPLARILEVQTSRDNNVRVARIKTITGEYVRPIHKLCLLPIIDNEQPFESEN